MIAETYTNANGSNMDEVRYCDLDIETIAYDLHVTVKGWDYAILTDEETGEVVATVFNEENGASYELA